MAIFSRNLLYFVLIILLLLIYISPLHSKELTILVGMYENRPKIFSDKNGQIKGIFPEILYYIADKEGWSIKFVKGNWTECLDRLEIGEIDLMVDVGYSEKRSQIYDFNNEPVFINWGVIYIDNSSSVRSLIDLKDKRIAVMKKSIHFDGENGIRSMLETFDIPCTYISADNYSEVFGLIENNEADAGVVNRIFGILHQRDYSVKNSSIVFNPVELRFGLPKNGALNSKLISVIDHYLIELKNDQSSEYYAIIDAYFSDRPYQKQDEKIKVNLTKEEIEFIKMHPTIRLGVDPEFVPFEYINDNGQYSGITSEYIILLNQRLGTNFQLIPDLTWPQAVEMAENNEIDVLPCVGITKERKKIFRYSRPYINFHRVIINRSDDPFVTNLEDCYDMKVAVQENSSHEGYLADHTDIEPFRYKTLQSALIALSNGKVDAFVGNIASATYWIRKLNLTNLKVAAPVSQEMQSLHFAVRKDWPLLVRIINKGLASISREQITEIEKKWVNVDYKPGIAASVVWRYVIRISIIVLLIIMIILFWNYRLKIEIANRKKAEAEVALANVHLKELDQLKSMFIASMSHELRTPLNSIIGFTGVIIKGMSGSLNEKQHDQLSRVQKSAKHLLSLITDIIDISKIEAGKIDIIVDEFLLSDIINEITATQIPLAEKKGLSLVVEGEFEILLKTDKRRLMQSLLNLVNNSIKYTENGKVTISVQMKIDELEINVTDTGIGISSVDMNKLFQPFERFDSHLKIRAGGSGLGLYLTRKIVTEILSGSINCDSHQGKGSTFTLTIPVILQKETESKTETGT